MNKRRLMFLGITVLIALISSCGLTSIKAESFSPDEAKNLILKNLFLGQSHFSIQNPHAWQYGFLHIDGTEGGILYKFTTSTVAFKWLLAKWQLEIVPINSNEELPLEFLIDKPNWWNPKKTKLSNYYFFQEKLDTGGEKKIILFFHSSSGIIYVVEDYSHLPGI